MKCYFTLAKKKLQLRWKYRALTTHNDKRLRNYHVGQASSASFSILFMTNRTNSKIMMIWDLSYKRLIGESKDFEMFINE